MYPTSQSQADSASFPHQTHSVTMATRHLQYRIPTTHHRNGYGKTILSEILLSVLCNSKDYLSLTQITSTLSMIQKPEDFPRLFNDSIPIDEFPIHKGYKSNHCDDI